MYGTIQVKIKADDVAMDFLVHQCKQSNSLINSAIYAVKQAHFEDCPRSEYYRDDVFCSGFKLRSVKTAKYAELCLKLKDNKHYKALGGQAAQQSLKSVSESFKSFNGILSNFFKGEATRPKMPGYRTKGGLAPISYPAQAVKFDLETGMCRLPVSLETGEDVKSIAGGKEIWINGCAGINPDQVREVRILPKNGELYAEFVYEYGNDGPSCYLGFDHTQALGIDPGVGNWLTCVSSLGKSFIVDGRKVKSINQAYNKRVAELKTGKAQGFWSDQLAALTEKRNRVIRDAINKAARLVVNHCIYNRIGVVVFGWNKGQKSGVNIGSVNNQNFVQIPTGRLKNRIQQICEAEGIDFVETEESYTSKTSFLDDDFLPTYGEKPESWKPSGKRGQRVKGKKHNLGRGGYQTKDGTRINSDCNGAANILRKVATQLGLNLAKVGKGALNLPKRYDLFKGLSKSYRKHCEASLQSA
jgi:IS605 OrfB family transposase